MTMADRIVVMKDGYVQQIGTPYDLYFNPTNVFVAGFIGEPPMNLIRTSVKDSAVNVGGVSLPLNKVLSPEALASVEGKDVVFGFRPEAITPGQTSDAFVMKGQVELTELLGDNTNVYVDMAEDKAILKVDPREAPEMDLEFEFSVPYKSVYIFDAETELAIGR